MLFVVNVDYSPICCNISWNIFQETLHKHKASENGKQSVEAVEAHLIDPQEKVEESASVDTKKSLFKNWPSMSSIIVYCIFSYHDMAYTEVLFSIF